MVAHDLVSSKKLSYLAEIFKKFFKNLLKSLTMLKKFCENFEISEVAEVDTHPFFHIIQMK